MKEHLQENYKCIRTIIILVFFIIFQCDVLLADDGASYVGDPVFNILCGDVKMKLLSAHISLDEDNINIKYSFLNKCNDDKILITIDIPPYRWEGGGNNYPDRSYSDFELLVNGNNVIYKKLQEAYYNGDNITNELAKYSIYPNDIANIDKWTDNMTDNEMEYYQPLRRKGIMSSTGFPNWEVKNAYIYSFTPNDNKIMSIEYKYTALPGYDYFSNELKDIFLLQKMNLNWSMMTKIYGSACDSYIIKWLTIPLYCTDNMKIDYIIIDISENKINPYIIALRNADDTFFYKGKAQISFKNYTHSCFLPVMMFAPLK
jgi:hypothetical protein